MNDRVTSLDTSTGYGRAAAGRSANVLRNTYWLLALSLRSTAGRLLASAPA